MMMRRFCRAAVKSVLVEVCDDLLREHEYDPDTSIELVKSVADEVHTRLQHGRSAAKHCLDPRLQ